MDTDYQELGQHGLNRRRKTILGISISLMLVGLVAMPIVMQNAFKKPTTMITRTESGPMLAPTLFSPPKNFGEGAITQHVSTQTVVQNHTQAKANAKDKHPEDREEPTLEQMHPEVKGKVPNETAGSSRRKDSEKGDDAPPSEELKPCPDLDGLSNAIKGFYITNKLEIGVDMKLLTDEGEEVYTLDSQTRHAIVRKWSNTNPNIQINKQPVPLLIKPGMDYYVTQPQKRFKVTQCKTSSQEDCKATRSEVIRYESGSVADRSGCL